MPRGKLILVIGPTGSGKGTLIAHARSLYPGVRFSISCTTRAPRPGEADGQQYHFLSREEFERRAAAGDFLEWASYGGNYYGTLVSEVTDRIDRGESVILEIEVQGARQIKETIPPEDLIIIFIDAGSWEELERRIRARAPMSEEEIANRKQRYEDEVAFMPEADAVIKNQAGGLDEAKEAFARLIGSAIGEAMPV